MKTTLLIMLFTAAICSAQETKPGEAPAKPLPTEAPPEMTGLETGKKAPSFTLKNHDGEELSLDAILKKGPTALVFYRSADW